MLPMKDLFISINYDTEVVEIKRNQPFFLEKFSKSLYDEDNNLTHHVSDVYIKNHITVCCTFECLCHILKRHCTEKEIKEFLTEYPKFLEYFI